MKNLAAGLLAIVFGLSLGITVVAWLADSTVLNPQAVLAAVPADTYPQAAKALPQALGQLTPLSQDEKLILADKIDPGLVRQIGDSLITQEIDYLHGHGQTPRLDLRELASRLRAEGAPLPQQLYDRLDQPISLQSAVVDQAGVPLVRWLDLFKVWGIIISLILAVLIWLLGAHLRFRTLAKGAVTAVLVVALSLAFVKLLPSLASSGFSTSPLASLAATIKAALGRMTAGYAQQSVRAMLALVAVAMVLTVAQVLFGREHKRRH